MRSHFIGLKRDLKKQNLQVPKQLQGADMEKFVRKRVFEDPQQIQRDEQLKESEMMQSPIQSNSPIEMRSC